MIFSDERVEDPWQGSSTLLTKSANTRRTRQTSRRLLTRVFDPFDAECE